MTEETGSTGGEAFTVTELPADAPESFNSASEAAAYFTSLKAPKPEKEQSAERAEAATAEHESPVEGDADPVTDPGETEEVEAAEPPIERPKSWSKDEDAEWQSLPRTMQQKIVARELERDTGTVRSQQKAAEAAKAAEAKAAQAEEVKQRYETKLPELWQALQDQNNQQFSEIKSMADVERFSNAIIQAANEGDFIKSGQLQAYLTGWNTLQQKMATTKAELEKAQGEKAQKHQSEWQDFRQSESAKASELIPELADKTKGLEFMTKAAKLLRDVNFSQNELNAIDGGEKISPFDHRMQSIIADAVRYRDIMAAKTAVAAKPLPPVQRPGNSKPPGSVQSERVQALNRKPELTVKEATELYELQSRSTRRAS